MSASNATVTPGNIVLTPMRVTFNGVDLGGTEGGVAVNVKYDIADIMVDQAGKTKVDGAVSGQEYSIKLTLAESKAKSNWKVAFPHAKLVGAGLDVYYDLQVADRLSAHTNQLLLHPLAVVDGDLSQDLLFYKAVCISASEVKYGPDKQSGISVEFRVLPDTGVVPWRFMLLGDPANGVVNAIAAAAVAGSNTGNGTITAQAPSNAGTKTETITISCVGIGASNSNEFSVTGSVSGILGVFNLAHANLSTTNFVAPGGQITFTANQGSTAFVVGDSFTIATTAANYT